MRYEAVDQLVVIGMTTLRCVHSKPKTRARDRSDVRVHGRAKKAVLGSATLRYQLRGSHGADTQIKVHVTEWNSLMTTSYLRVENASLKLGPLSSRVIRSLAQQRSLARLSNATPPQINLIECTSVATYWANERFVLCASPT